MKKIILGSSSPRRRELMEMMEFSFVVDSRTDFEEKIPEGMDPYEVPSYLAKGKSLGFHRTLSSDEILVTADTVVICQGCILGKPHSADAARRMLRFLSGQTHYVVSAVCVRTQGEMEDSCRVFSDTASVTFSKLTDGQIDHYVSVYSPMDKAGGYGIQEWIGLTGITSIQGSFYTIMGLPSHLLYQHLTRLGG